MEKEAGVLRSAGNHSCQGVRDRHVGMNVPAAHHQEAEQQECDMG